MDRILHVPLLFLLGAVVLPAQNSANPQPAPQPQWVQGGKPAQQAWQVVWLLQNSGSLGLNPANYQASNFESQLHHFNSGAAAALNNQLTAAVERFVSDLEFGRIPQSNSPEQTQFAQETAYKLSTSQNPSVIVSSLAPQYPEYQRLVKILPGWQRLASQHKFALIPVPRKPVKVGENWPGFPAVQQLLTETGDMRSGVSLDDAIKAFQERHGLKPDGMLSQQTVQQMNVPFSWRVRQIELTLERLREAPRSYAPPMVIVNIPAFQLKALDKNGQPAFTMNVVDGEAIGHQTPTFDGKIQYVVFNPYWDVPEDIAKKQVVPLFRRDPKYFSENGFEIVDKSDHVVAADSPAAAALDGVMEGTYRVRQRPGPKNALGDVKFVFPNSNAVYMHGTPAHELFSHMDRDFSHGCIRLQDPEKMADWVFQQSGTGWTPDKIHEAMTDHVHLRVNLKNPIPVVITYGTADVNPSGQVYFFNDVYGLDASLNKQLMEQDQQRSAAGQQTAVQQESAHK